MGRMISALIKRPGEPPRHVNLSNSLKALQKNVGGYIETVTVEIGVAVICNEEGRLLGLPHNCYINGIEFVGEIIMCGVNGDEFDDLPFKWEDVKKVFPELWEE